MSVVTLRTPTGQQLGRFIQALASARGDIMGAQQVASARGWTSTSFALKALMMPLTQAELGSALSPISNDVAEVLRPLTIIGRLQGLRRVPFNTKLLTADVGGAGDWVYESEPIPVRAADFSVTAILDAKKVAGIRVLTEELVRHAETGSDETVANDAAGGIVEALDGAFIDPANGGTLAKPASITYGATAYSSSGSTISAIDADLGKLLRVLIDAEMSLASAAWLMAPTTAVTLSLTRGTSGDAAYPGMTARGGALLGLPVLTSTSIEASGSPGERFIALAEASEIYIADDGRASIDLSTAAAVQMNDAPASGAQQLVSLWQLGMVGIKVTRFANWHRRRDGAVAVLRDVTY